MNNVNKGVADTHLESFQNGGAERKRTEVKSLENLHVNSIFKRVYTQVVFFFLYLIDLFYCSLIKNR